jgi:hypothetical protein
MDLKRAQKFCVASRSLLYMIPLSILLLASFSWSVWQYRLDQERRAQAKVVERASMATAASAREQAVRAEFSRRATDARSDTRVQQLYDEINQLTRLSERVLLDDQVARSAPAIPSGRDKPVSSP